LEFLPEIRKGLCKIFLESINPIFESVFRKSFPSKRGYLPGLIVKELFKVRLYLTPPDVGQVFLQFVVIPYKKRYSDVMLEIGESLVMQGDIDGAIITYDDVTKEYKKTPQSARA